MIKNLVAIITVAIGLSACANNQLQQLAVQDTQKAVEVAKAVNDAPAVQCFTGFNQLATALGQPVPMDPAMVQDKFSTALATKIETVRGVRQVLHDDCGSLSADFLANVLHGIAGPFAGLIP